MTGARPGHDPLHPGAGPQLGAGGAARVGERLIEHGAIDDQRARLLRVDRDAAAVGGDERSGVGSADDRLGRKIEFGEGIGAEDAGAVHGHADLGVLFENNDVVASRRERPRRRESGGPGADYGDITHGTRSEFAATHFPSAKHANPK